MVHPTEISMGAHRRDAGCNFYFMKLDEANQKERHVYRLNVLAYALGAKCALLKVTSI